jgi:phosphate transport system ATP-binding protein
VSPEEPIVVTVDPMRTSWDSAPSRPSEAERELASFPGSAVVQVVQGDAHRPDAVIAELHSATVRITDQRVLATDGDIAWAWLVTDLAAVVHGADAPWTIFDVPGISDFGVAVPADEVDRFREVLGRLPGVDVRHQEGANGRPVVATAPAHEPASAVPASLAAEPMASFPPPDPDTGPVPLVIAEASAVSSASLAPLVAAPAPVEPLGLPGAPDGLAGLDARDISAWFGDHQVLDRVSLHMEAGKVTALIGPSGCGKSTFLRILNRMHEMIPAAAMAGEVLLDGHDLYDANRKLTDARREVGMVFQKPNPFPSMSIYDNVLASLRLTGTKARVDVKDALVESCLSKAGLWNEVKDRLRSPGGGLSGGQQQRLCIARALAIKPRVLLMDEPCSALDPTSTRRIEETIIELVHEVTIVIVTHNMQQAARVSDHCAFFLASQGTPGVIVEHGPTDAMFNAPQDGRTLDYVTGRFG